MKDGAVLFDHDVAVVSVFDVQQILYEAETWVSLCKTAHNSLVSKLFGQFLKVSDQSIFLLVFDFMNRGCMFNKFVKCSASFRDDLVCKNVVFTEDGVQVFDELHGDDFVGQLIVVFVEVVSKLEVQHQGVSVLCLNVKAIFDVYVD